jgi:hypothetical protein
MIVLPWVMYIYIRATPRNPRDGAAQGADGLTTRGGGTGKPLRTLAATPGDISNGPRQASRRRWS